MPVPGFFDAVSRVSGDGSDRFPRDIVVGRPPGDPAFSRFDVEISDRDPFSLSRGELKRVMLACVFAKDPDVLILDEPYASLDVSAKDVLTSLIENRRGITIVFSHETEFAPNHAERWKIYGGGMYRE